jgi:hypothetical protein
MICGLLLLSSMPAMAQDIQLAGFSYTRFPSAKVKSSPLNQEMEVNEYTFFVNLPQRLTNEKTVLVHGLQYRWVLPTVDNDLHLGLDGENLHLIGYRFTVLHQLSSSWSAVVSLNPVVSSTFNTALEGDDFLLNGVLHFTKKQSDRFSYGGGIALTSRFGEPIPVPTLQLTFSSEKDKFRVFLPRHITYDRYFGRFTVGLQVASSGSRYNVNHARTNFLNEIELVDKLAYSRAVLGPSLSYRVGKFLKLEASGGITVARRVEHQGDLLEDQNYDIANGPFFRFGIAIVPAKKYNE